MSDHCALCSSTSVAAAASAAGARSGRRYTGSPPAIALLLPRRDPHVDPLLEHVHRQRAGAEDLVVEGADVEAVAELAAGALAQLGNLDRADFVAEGLAGPDAVAVGLVLHLDLVFRGAVVEELHGL